MGNLKLQTAFAFDEVVKDRVAIAEAAEITLPKGCDALTVTLKRLDCAIRFARWRQDNERLVRDVAARVLGRMPKEGEPSEKVTLTGKLLDLDATMKAANPVSDALVQCGRLTRHLKVRRAAETRLAQYAIASAALGNLGRLGV